MRIQFALLLALIAVPTIAHADTVFDLSATLGTGRDGDTTGAFDKANPITGTLTMNDAGNFTAVDLNYEYNISGNAIPEDIDITSFHIGSDTQDGSFTVLDLSGSGALHSIGAYVNFKMYIPTSELFTQDSISFCGAGSSPFCGGDAVVSLGSRTLFGGSNLYDATLTRETPLPVTATTPEPSSLLLLGTGISGLAAIIKRRIQTV